MLPPGFYFRAFSGKRSFAPPADQSDWFVRASIELSNGDNVGVATPWQYPASEATIPPELVDEIVTEIGRGLSNGQRYTNHNAAQKRAVWSIVQKHCPDKTREQCQRIVAGWVKCGRLYVDEYFDPVQRRQQSGLFAPDSEDDEA